MKKTLVTLLALVLSISLLSACGKDSASGDYVPEKLTVQFVPSQTADTLEAKAKPLE